MDWLRGFRSDQQLQTLVTNEIKQASPTRSEDEQRRHELTSQLERLQDLYILGDLTPARRVAGAFA